MVLLNFHWVFKLKTLNKQYIFLWFLNNEFHVKNVLTYVSIEYTIIILIFLCNYVCMSSPISWVKKMDWSEKTYMYNIHRFVILKIIMKRRFPTIDIILSWKVLRLTKFLDKTKLYKLKLFWKFTYYSPMT